MPAIKFGSFVVGDFEARGVHVEFLKTVEVGRLKGEASDAESARLVDLFAMRG